MPDATTDISSWWNRAHAGDDGDPLVAYFSMEFAVDADLPIYSGGLGVLAGDHLKAAADLGLPLVGVGLFYRGGYFTQSVSAEGRQTEDYHAVDPEAAGLVREPVEVRSISPARTCRPPFGAMTCVEPRATSFRSISSTSTC